ncbi:MAG: hypothetical protein R3E77_02455 [Steroidobacteraceae bacterium]
MRKRHVRGVGILLALMVGGVPPSLRSAGDDNWQGSIRSEITVVAQGYSHQETQTWTLAGAAPTVQGSVRSYPATWTVTAQGSHDRTRNSDRRIAQWSANLSSPVAQAPIGFTVMPNGALNVGKWHAQLTVSGGYSGTDQFIISGAPQTQQQLSATVYEWQFPKIEDRASATQLTGSNTTQVRTQVGPLQPSDAVVTVTTTWALGRGTAPSMPPLASSSGSGAPPPGAASDPFAGTPPANGAGSDPFANASPATGGPATNPPGTSPAGGDPSSQPVRTPPPSITVDTPRETWTRGQTHTVTWTHNITEPGSGFNVMAHFTLENGTTANTAFGFSGSMASPGTFTGADQLFDFPSPAVSAHVSVTFLKPDGFSSGIRAESNEFPVAPMPNATTSVGAGAAGTVRVLFPNGGEVWQSGNLFTVFWTHTYPETQSFDIDVSVDNGVSWETLATAPGTRTPDSQSRFTVSTPARSYPGTSGLIRISPSGNVAAGDISDAPFTFVAQSTDPSSPGTSRGLSTRLARFYANVGWQSPSSGSPVSTTQVPRPTVGSEQWFNIGAWDDETFNSQQLAFSASISGGAAGEQYDIELSEQTSATPTTLASSGASSTPRAAYAWANASGVADDRLLYIRVRRTVGSSSGNYTLTLKWGEAPQGIGTATVVPINPTLLAPPRLVQIKVVSPNGGESWAAGQQRFITWTHNLGAAQAFAVDCSTDRGATWTTISDWGKPPIDMSNVSPGLVGVFAKLPDSLGSTALVRVRMAGEPQGGDTSDDTFSLVTPVIVIQTPVAGERWVIGSRPSPAVTWFHNLWPTQSFNVQISRDGGVTWGLPAGNSSGKSSVQWWELTGPATTRARIRVTSTTGGFGAGGPGTPKSVVAESANFTIADP